MAKEDIVFSAKVDSSESGKSLSDLRKEFKELTDEVSRAKVGTEEYAKSFNKLSAVKSQINDLNDTLKTISPEGKIGAFQNVAGKLASGFQAATGAAALFGVQSKEVEEQLLKIQAAMALADGIKGVQGLTGAMSTFATVIKTQVVTAFSTLKGAIAATGIGALIVAIGVLIYKVNEYNDAIEEEYDKQRRLNEELEKTTEGYLKQAAASEKLRNTRKGGLNELERELKLLEASGASSQEIADKKQAILDKELDNLKIRRATVYDDAKAVAELDQQILDKEAEKTALILANQKRINDEAKKLREERKKQEEQDFQDAIAQGNKLDDEEAKRSEIDREKAKKEREEDAKFFEEQDKLRLDAEQKQRDQDAKNEEFLQGYYKRESDRLQKKVDDEKKAAEEIARVKMQLETLSFQTARDLSDAFFTSKLQDVEKGSKAEYDIRKKQFEVEKAFNIARATIDGFRAVQAALIVPPPFGPILAIAQGAAAAANIAKIAAVKFNSGAGFSPATPNSNAASSAPNIQTAAPNVTTSTTSLNEQGQNLSINATFVETQATSTQNRVKRLQNQASFP